MTHLTSPSNLPAFLINPGIIRTLEKAWVEKDHVYVDVEDGKIVPLGILHYLLNYHTYQALLGDKTLPHAERAESLLRTIAASVQENGYLRDMDGASVGHPALAGHVADGLGTGCYYGPRLNFLQEVREMAKAALLRIEEYHPCYRLPEGIVGGTQQMRFELIAHYWAWRLTNEQKYKDKYVALWNNGLESYVRLKADSGMLMEPSLHPDYTWNYACASGRSNEYCTNTHTPTYYNTEPQGFAFAYAHALKDKALAPNPAWSEFCRKFLMGLWRNLSRAGHTVTDLDGYGIHRAWFSGCLLETAPFEAIGLADTVGIDPKMKSWFRWYIDQYIGFIQRQPSYQATGLPPQLPYGHAISIEKQFRTLVGARFYTHMARAIYEYEIDQVAPEEPPAQWGYAWWHNWLRVSTPVYETSFVGTTSGRQIPVVRSFGDPNLGTIHGGSPLSTLFVGKSLMFATSTDPAGLWHAEIRDVNGNIHRSCATTFSDEIAMAVKTSDGRLLSRDDFQSYEDPHYSPIDIVASEVIWSKNLRNQNFRFSVHNSYGADSLQLNWGCHFSPGLFAETVAFIVTVPVQMNPEVQLGTNQWIPINSFQVQERWPTALRWSDGTATIHADLKPSRAGIPGRLRIIQVEKKERSPGGEKQLLSL